jgi:replicative DNA helicase
MPITDRPTIAHQENLITILAHDNEHGKLVASQIDPTLFEGIYRVVAERCRDYWRRYGKAPGTDHFADLFADLLEDPGNRQGNSIRRILLASTQLSESINTEYVLKILRDFTRGQLLKSGILEAAEVLNRSLGEQGNAKVEEIFSGLLRTHTETFDPGVRLSNIDFLMQHLGASEHNEFVTGIPVLDRRHVVPTRATLMVFLGVTGHGKTWWLINLGQQALMYRKKVVHVTLELAAGKVFKRYVQNLLAIPLWDDKLTTSRSKLLIEDNCLIGIEREQVTAKFSMQSPQFRQRLDRFIGYRPAWFDNMVIKKYPTRGLTVAQLRGYLDSLEASGFMPDLLIVDYAGLMQTDRDNYRISLGRVLEELRGLGEERNIAVVTAQQVSKEGAQAAQVRKTHIAEDWSIAGTADFVLSLTRTQPEEIHKLAQLWVDKNRDDDDGFGAVLSQNYTFGQFVHDSAVLDRAAYLQLLGNL